ncbi:MAG: aspartyl/asparaginyl beta-hydroxylase domain-containing protein [Acidobacteria bacterium]|nr:aspartyl/asparaginyl beta-hydroxylase domain-containing protein [Acidobacteriota bacterium]
MARVSQGNGYSRLTDSVVIPAESATSESTRVQIALPDTARRDPASRFLRIAEGLDVTPLLAELDVAPEMWLADTSRQRKVRCQRDTQNIFLRAARKPLPPGAKNANDVHETRTMRSAGRFPAVMAFCEEIATLHGGELGRATLVALQPHGWVRPHRDAGDYYRIRDRFHLVLRSPGGSPLTCGEDAVVMQEGELWTFDNKVRHEARNPTEEPRVHLIFDVLPPPGRGYYARSGSG